MSLLSSGFVGLGEIFAQKASDVLTMAQGVPTFRARPVSQPANSFSFDFAGAAQKLFQPITDLFDPRRQAAGDIIRAGSSAVTGLISAGADIAKNALFNLGAQPKPDVVILPPSTPSNNIPSQTTGSNLRDVIALLSSLTPVSQTPSNANSLAEQAAANSRTNVLLIGGIGLVLVLLTMSKSRGR